MGYRHLLVSDIDGTLLQEGEATPGLKALRRLIRTHADDVALVYATGRSITSTLSLISRDILPKPQAIAPFVGTELWMPGWYQSREYQKMLEPGWQPDEIRHYAQHKFGMRLQESRFQSPLKLSFYVEKPEQVKALNSFLKQRDLPAKLVYSCGKYLDVIPARAGKASAVRYLMEQWHISEENVLACGDSGNDVDMLTTPDTCNVAVGNLEEELQNLADKGHFYVAELPYAGGVLEGAVLFNFWPSSH